MVLEKANLWTDIRDSWEKFAEMSSACDHILGVVHGEPRTMTSMGLRFYESYLVVSKQTALLLKLSSDLKPRPLAEIL